MKIKLRPTGKRVATRFKRKGIFRVLDMQKDFTYHWIIDGYSYEMEMIQCGSSS